ncbi:catechol 1,2-dioxygenase [Sphingomonas sp. MG17]|uniref:Catechol 1,2-dioxygenase n=1 Tax=Sphingomonas tagetis TaxID=2949092 RepID=A0A9X2KMW4_9SPHN|nr:catechol 1,2-dioxygenase [Sphingomonas tagetis]
MLRVMQATPDPRLRELMVALIKHLHGFVREVGLTEAEFRTATALINRIGQLSNARHNEAVLMAGSLGVSALVCLLNNGNAGQTETSQSLLGPFWRMHSPVTPNGGSIVRSETPGDPVYVRLRVVDPEGRPVAGAEVDVWQAAPTGLYENQDDAQADHNLRGKLTTDATGIVDFWTVRTVGYPIPTGGVVGELLGAQKRHPFRPAHLHALVVKQGFKVLISQIYDPADPNIDSDVQFAVTSALTAEYVRHEEPRDGIDGPWHSLDFTLTMEPGDAVLPRAPID